MVIALVSGTIFGFFVVFVVLAYRLRWAWTGFAGKTAWEWLQLLVIPVTLAGGALALNYLQAERQRHEENRRAARERAIASDTRREDALQAYLDRMSDLILDRGLATARHGSG